MTKLSSHLMLQAVQESLLHGRITFLVAKLHLLAQLPNNKCFIIVCMLLCRDGDNVCSVLVSAFVRKSQYTFSIIFFWPMVQHYFHCYQRIWPKGKCHFKTDIILLFLCA